jgi:hypothetical protein
VEADNCLPTGWRYKVDSDRSKLKPQPENPPAGCVDDEKPQNPKNRFFERFSRLCRATSPARSDHKLDSTPAISTDNRSTAKQPNIHGITSPPNPRNPPLSTGINSSPVQSDPSRSRVSGEALTAVGDSYPLNKVPSVEDRAKKSKYLQEIKRLLPDWPELKAVSEYLDHPKERNHLENENDTVYAVDYLRDGDDRFHRIDCNGEDEHLKAHSHVIGSDAKGPNDMVAFRLILVPNPSSSVLLTLGDSIQINPQIFISHLRDCRLRTATTRDLHQVPEFLSAKDFESLNACLYDCDVRCAGVVEFEKQADNRENYVSRGLGRCIDDVVKTKDCYLWDVRRTLQPVEPALSPPFQTYGNTLRRYYMGVSRLTVHRVSSTAIPTSESPCDRYTPFDTFNVLK